ncbi:seryl-tRNA synthetase [Gloeothece citriformis PCC 7424]|uniref:Serine--tRNA ligase n=1 Tax=Gloeothece citriformis (strain PCC 7424) TaxID=65393 RepID=SYS_GLOC7|nr:serine--tRNA ligase [Gloeothece citriformis]B7KCF5.1 RecName: Full=Serine--tRNA ligase; AltName: Full=Seryl-tRNA synthetase; Short=SerRS; AltName: Full=Seryl-tRNA(Ser/Sec) synthetase [Gloeothece citriformis PCC 7424]ACK70260.1 seryl-tRNA synthetase [Gloeothece citriformis PCC 7424]
MLDIKQIRENPELVQEKLNRRSAAKDYDLTPILQLDERQRELESSRVQLQTRGNEISKLIPQKIKGGSDPKGEEIKALKEEGNTVKNQLSSLEPQEKEIKAQIESLLLQLPNLPSDSTPLGKDETENVEIRRWGDEYLPKIKVLPHWEIGEKLGILDFERAVKVAQSRFVNLIGAGAALERALINFMLDRQIEAGYLEVMPPILINTTSLQGTGQLPKFSEESFKCSEDELWLAPTAEVPVTNLYRDNVIEGEQLPIKHCAYTPCFRREAGSYGKDTRGLIRLHQFNKVELVKLVHPETSEAEHEALVKDAEAILQALKLPYRVIELCTGDLGFGAAKCYDIEVWLPSSDTYREISSCSNFRDFQARRANIRFKEKGKKGTQYVHTLNGSGLAIGRTMSAILENYQQEDGTIKVPEVLQPYLKREVIGKS